MRFFGAHSRLLGLVTPKPLGHARLQPNTCAAAPKSVRNLQNTITNPTRRAYSTKMMDGSDLDNNVSSDDSDMRRPSTVDDVHVLTVLLNEITGLRSFRGRAGLGDEKIKSMCGMYKCLEPQHKGHFILTLASSHGVDHDKVRTVAQSAVEIAEKNAAKVSKCEDSLRNALSPQYSWLFNRIGRLENGVKFLVDFRTDILTCLSETEPDTDRFIALQELNVCLRDLLAMWFSVGFLHLERVTWRSPCEMLQKISEYEAVHPVRSWTDIKRRVGPYRRCFVFTHSSMEGEPLVVLHTALCDEIPASLGGIVSARTRMSLDAGNASLLSENPEEDQSNIKAGIFYSITSTQRGLQGIDLGNYLIKKVVRELLAEFPRMTMFSTLSPIPNFRPWLLEKIKAAERGKGEIFTPEEMDNIRRCVDGEDFWPELRRIIKKNVWVDSTALSSFLREPLLRLCARYLYLEKRRSFALCSVGNFHLSNGATLWRINWKADLSVRGLTNSCGIMVNYRYFLEDTERNSEKYLEQQVISASDEVSCQAAAAEAVALVSKM